MKRKKDEFKTMGVEILKKIGGKENVASVTHCMTRLRFNLKDMSFPNDNEVKKIRGVLGVMRAGGQYQVVIGQTVNEVYDEVVASGNLKQDKPIVEERVQNTEKVKMTWKSVGSTILNKIAGSLTPIIPMLVAASMFKMLVAVFGPNMFNVISENSDVYKLFSLVGDAGFYFFPIIIGYTSAKQFKTSPILGMFLGAIMLDPNLTSIVNAKKAFTVFGIPMQLVNYSSTVVPILLSVWIMSYVEKFFNKKIHSSIRTVFAPTLTIFVMLPISLCFIGPLGGFLGNYICNGILAFGRMGGFPAIIGIALIGAFWELLVITGMHLVMISAMMLLFAQKGYDNFVSLGSAAASLSVSGMCLGAALRLKNKEERSLALSYLVAGIIGGVTEPALYGIAIRYKKPFIGMMIGGFFGGLYAGSTHLTAYVLVPIANFLALSRYVGGTTTNIINGILSGVIAFAVAAIATYILGLDTENKLHFNFKTKMKRERRLEKVNS
ncbi:PTS transporter subunit EIIC [Liquorilactobacillus uvarum]|uniref:PTS transporter subunit EIIC n=1 Tax=Liquorilactobacillus uvarum TaxID=303240 RepID=UPI00288AE306|nr:PTS transporter subunit EIIC [Liquorilactobacillus uvarum]